MSEINSARLFRFPLSLVSLLSARVRFRIHYNSVIPNITTLIAIRARTRGGGGWVGGRSGAACEKRLSAWIAASVRRRA